MKEKAVLGTIELLCESVALGRCLQCDFTKIVYKRRALRQQNNANLIADARMQLGNHISIHFPSRLWNYEKSGIALISLRTDAATREYWRSRYESGSCGFACR